MKTYVAKVTRLLSAFIDSPESAQSPRSHSVRVFPLAVAIFVAVSSALSAAQLETQWTHAGSDGVASRHLTDPSGNSLSDSYMSALGHAEISSVFGGIDVTGGIAYSDHNNHTLAAKGTYTDTITITPADSSLIGQSGTAIFTFHLTGNMSMSYSSPGAVRSYNNFHISIGDTDYQTGTDYSDGTHTGPAYIDFTTFTYQRAITFGATFDLPVFLSIGSNTSRDNGESIVVADQLSLIQGTITFLNNSNQPVACTLGSRTGSAGQTPVSAGSSYSGFTVNNPATNGHVGTTVSLLDGSASNSTVVDAAFTAPPPSNEIQLTSDAVDVTGTGSDVVVIQVSYSAALAQSIFGSEDAMRLAWFNPTTGQWLNAVAGNNGGTPHFFARAYNPATDLQLGNFGLDTTNHVVWAVINHNSEFGVGAVADPLALVSATSRLTHGQAGDFNIDLPLSGSPGVECRNAGSYQIVLTFSAAVTSGTAAVTSGAATTGTPTFNGNTMVVPLTNLANAQIVTLTVSNVNGVLPPADVKVAFLAGDTTGEGSVNSADIGQTKSQSGHDVTALNFREDLNADGSINSGDISLAKSRSGSGINLARGRNTRD